LLIASDKLTWKFDAVDQEGAWALHDGNGSRIVAATGGRRHVLIPALLDHASRPNDPTSRRLMDAIDAAVKANGVPDEPTRARLDAIARNPGDDPVTKDMSRDVRLMLQVSVLTILQA
jgi:hypothetical protein